MVERVRAIASHGAHPWFPLYYVFVVAGGMYLLGSNLGGLAGVSWVLVLFWLVLILAADAAPVSLPGGGFITVSSALDFAGILILGPVPVALIEFAATLILQLGFQRRPKRRALFNASAFAGTVLVAGWVFQVLGGVPGGSIRFPEALMPLAGLGATYYALNTALMSLVIGLSERRKPWHVWQVNYTWTTLHLLSALPFGVAFAVAMDALGIWGGLLFIVPLLLARYAFKLYIDAKRDLFEFAGVLSGVIDEFDPYTCSHSRRVSHYSARLARELGFSERGVEEAEYAGLLHDIGKIALSQRDLIVKPGPLTAEERVRISLHADIGADILGKVSSFEKLAPVVRYHHERMDGNGYHRLPEEDIPAVAKIVMVADAFDAMTSDRVYRKAMSVSQAREELDRHAGTQFDEAVVSALHRLVERGEMGPGEEIPQYEPSPWPEAGVVAGTR